MIDLNEDCKFCGKELWTHTHRQSPHGIDLMPCDQKFRDMCLKFVGYNYDELANETGECKECGKPLINHFVFQRLGMQMMGIRV